MMHGPSERASEDGEPRWVPRQAVDAVHADLVRSLGGLLGIRDAGLLESALARPQNRCSLDPTADLSALAAAYGFGIAKNHPYVDGNKRTASMVMYMFLRLNGFRLIVEEHEMVAAMLSVASGSTNETQLGAWIRSNIQPVTRSTAPRPRAARRSPKR